MNKSRFISKVNFLIYVVVYMCHQQVRLKYLNYLISQELIGAEIVRINNYKEFMVLLLKNKVNLMNTYSYFRKEKNEIGRASCRERGKIRGRSEIREE